MEKYNILLVEDDTSLGFIIADQLTNQGFKVVLASDGAEGFKLFNEQPFQLCILDVMMPKKDGISLAEDIRSIDKNVPILFLSAKSMTEDKVAGFEAGADDYLTKPFSSDELALRVKALLRRSKNSPSEIDDTLIPIGGYQFDKSNFVLKKEDFQKKLTKKEANILKILCKFENQVVPREVVLNAVWGQDDYFVGRSLDVFITKLRKYFSLDSSVQIENIHGIGFKLTTKIHN
ncbi:MAG: response regulator transcription factor [Crocinitomicaceae bacterium]|nr:response regulator transcription factor [Crocinitomicaceae bacterium]